MGHLPDLIRDLALILVAGAITTIIFRKIKQPLVLGYIIAGFLVGPHFELIPTVVDNANIKTLADIGVIFLLFGLGLEFSFKKLLRVGGAASITAFVEIIFITTTGYFAGQLMGWTTMDSLFLGGMLASSSTTIIIRAFDELGMKTKQFARIVFGVLVVEDIVVILLMVLLSTMAVSQQFEGSEMLFTVLKLLFFLAVWFISGIFLLPTLLKKARKLLDEETLLITAIGLCLGMVVLATQVGFSAELGAFIMGSIIAETTSAEKVEHLIKPVKDLFGAVFFVSVGMMIDPRAIAEYGLPVLVVTLLTLVGKLFSTTLGAMLSGQPLKQSMQVGMSMAQIGEFAFIVATLGLSLGVISDFLFPVAVGASAITTFTTPYLIKLSGPFHDSLVKVLPEKWVNALNAYSSNTQKIQAESDWKIVLKSYARIVATNGVIILALMLLSFNFLIPFLARNFQDDMLRNTLGLVISLGIGAPFLWALMARRPDNIAYKELWTNRKYNRGPLLIIEILRNALGILLIGFWVNRFFSTLVALLVAVPIIILVMVIFSQRIQTLYRRLEGSFLSNLNARERAALENESLASEVLKRNSSLQPALDPWDAHIVDLEVGQQAAYAGETLRDLGWREKYGINVVYLKRGEKLIHAPGRDQKVLPFDHVGIIATDDQLQTFMPVFNATESSAGANITTEDIALQKIVIDEHTSLRGRTLRDSGIRENLNGLVVGIERDGNRILNPDSNMKFEWDDIVWVVGDRKLIQHLRDR
ncbi:transporter (CPA2 family) [Anseongella ginsenosidimutans]|uniref:Transporter (CPA2 family) n=1 Tax=Anseongella ginsenosidimutans TaxID=496056 RepID=A0A4R3KNW4_9SPHI|nr:cation:proton antiporter [Anseongella ginsenosidimutans]QEC53888.1 sodium:proton antiporter [Anseongella ginsenosidimutans]TCS86270.1 transporter (CPA2 family) [Anseongella ginsenosidimutans]